MNLSYKASITSMTHAHRATNNLFPSHHFCAHIALRLARARKIIAQALILCVQSIALRLSFIHNLAQPLEFGMLQCLGEVALMVDSGVQRDLFGPRPRVHCILT